MTLNEEFEPVYDELHHRMQDILPERCRGCGHTSKGLRRLAAELLANQITTDDATQEMIEAAQDVERHCVLGYVQSERYPDQKICSFEIKPYLLDPDHERNKYFDIRFEN
jgi:hypothetical protein